ncbi:formamidopyrimidine-DNA glycosylase [Anoxybacillus voinovskiensis]|uniref:Formamidopyrimidine-DNA glycosylase n=1 Tax=Anoxybacteroides voinovskiense TaxID=230470 RepID=A0A840DP22_9BACL|nr:DNA-formamidopyrimidine glycosylase [Anoxybacillus voinovskiensis]MBB4074740.1 formamidopyrimidine-DNA glycosylase [Anoxybacillus voinovskiensis]GGJ72436.1 formamidopyrimidine-DNA glycosylase [Anoxybacillus voinovskiensis]
MPELPEVETVKRTLLPLTAGKTIERVEVFWENIIKKPDVATFTEMLQGQTVRGIERRGKFLKFLLDDYVLVSHLRMEGRYRVAPASEPLEPHTHVILHFDDGTQLRYRDVRKFGTMHLFKAGEEEKELPLAKLGPEPFSAAFTPAFLMDKLKKTNRMLKSVLLDQTVVVGLGNIYVDETLFRSQLHPERSASSLTAEEIERLHREIAATLKEAIAHGGSTVRSYVNTEGKAGTFQQQLFVYGRKGEPCKRCGHLVQKIIVAGRGTHYCAQCQQ